MNFHVHIESILPGEFLFTHGTLKRLYAGVGSLVTSEKRLATKALPTYLTRVNFLLRLWLCLRLIVLLLRITLRHGRVHLYLLTLFPSAIERAIFYDKNIFSVHRSFIFYKNV